MVCTVFLWDNGFVLELHQVLKGLQEPNLIIPNVFTMLSSLQLYSILLEPWSSHSHIPTLLLGETKKKTQIVKHTHKKQSWAPKVSLRNF